jgi:hypothetical protein
VRLADRLQYGGVYVLNIVPLVRADCERFAPC